jgi:tetratricopeptide (TPR) repeat protein
MSQDDFRIFLSAVTSEFGRARDAVAADLRSRGLLLRLQSDFRQEAGSDTTLQKLHDYIRDGSAVVCVIGKRSGALPTPKEAEPFVQMLPGGIATASYTQWEFFFARHFKRRLFIYIATGEYEPDLAAPTSEDDPELQQAFLDHVVKEQGRDRSYFANEDQLARLVLKQDWPKKRTGKPIALSYPSLGGLFKGHDAFLQELHASLSRGSGRTAITGSALYGLGGIGKTRAAVEYAWAHQQDYTALLFVIAETPEALRRNLAVLVGPLVLNLREQSAAEEDVRLKAVLNNLAILLETTNRPSEAEPLYRRALAIGEASYDPNHPEVAAVLNNLAGLLQNTNRPSDAEPFYWRALAIYEASYGPDHPDVAKSFSNLASLLTGTKRLVEAEPLFRRALAISEASYGPDHPDVRSVLATSPDCCEPRTERTRRSRCIGERWRSPR